MPKPSPKSGLPPLDWLRIFEAAARLGGFSAAAREFGLTQAAVSQRIRNLETWLGRDLFIRSARGVTLTYAGEGYLPMVQDALQSLERGTEALFGKTPRELRIAALSSHLDALVLPRLPVLSAVNPTLRVATSSVPQRTAFDTDNTPLQLRFGHGAWNGREAALIQPEVLVPMATPRLAETRDAPLIDLRGERPGWRDWARHANQPPPGGTPQLSVDSMQHALTAAAAGAGIALGSRALAAALLADGRLVELPLPAFETAQGYWLTWPRTEFRSRPSRGLLTALVAALQESG